MNTHHTQPGLILASLIVGLASHAIADEKIDSNTQSSSQSISVSVSSSTQDDGVNEPKSQVSGRIKITGPDGVEKEFNLGDALPDGLQLRMGGLPDEFELLTEPTEAREPRPMIGIMSSPVSELLRKHLKLGISGVVVTGVAEEMPAAKAGIRRDDIILTANGKIITDQNDLAVVVMESNEKEFDVVMLRDGEKKTVRLKAEVTSPVDIHGLADSNAQKQMNQFMLQGFGPGMQLQTDGDMNKQISQLMQQARKAALDARKAHGNGKEVNRELNKLRARVAELEKRLEHAKSAEDESE